MPMADRKRTDGGGDQRHDTLTSTTMEIVPARVGRVLGMVTVANTKMMLSPTTGCLSAISLGVLLPLSPLYHLSCV